MDARSHDLGVGSEIPLKLSYTSSNGEEITATGTGTIHSNSMIDPSLPKHQIRLANVSFPDLNISNATFRIQPQYGQIYLNGNQLADSAGQPIETITISMNITEDNIYKPIDSTFIGTDIARSSAIPTKTSQLTNDSNFVTSTELATKQDKLDSYSDSASVANDKLTINYKVKQEDGTYSNVPVEFSGGSKYTFTNGLTETDGTVSWDLKNNYTASSIILSKIVDNGDDKVIYTHNTGSSDDYLTFKPRYFARNSKRLIIVHENSREGLDIYIDKKFNGSTYLAPINDSTTTLGIINSK